MTRCRQRRLRRFKMKMGSAVPSFLQAVSCRLLSSSVMSSGPTQPRGLTPLSHHAAAAAASGKESFITHARQFLQLSRWFSCVLRDEYKEAWCSSLAGTPTPPNDRTLFKKKLVEVLRQLDSVRQILQHDEKMLSTPPLSVEDSCCLSALQCFRANLRVQFNVTERKQRKLYRSLTRKITEEALCIPTNSGDVQATCQDCDSLPKENAREFFRRLQSLVQKGISRLSPN